MADQPSNPKKIKDLKARLGRTVAPGTSGRPEGMSPPGASQRPSSPGGVPAPGAAPRTSVPAPVAPIGPGSVAPPPFMGRTSQPPAGDPFAPSGLAPQRGPQEVRIVVDDSAVEETAAAKKSFTKVALILGFGAVAGLAVGYGVGAVGSEKKQFDLAVQDAKDIITASSTAKGELDKARTAITRAVKAAKGEADGKPTVDYAAIEQLRSLKQPFDAGQFARRRYLAFETATVDDLFTYYNNIMVLWQRMERLANRSLPPDRRKALDASAASAEVFSSPTGCVPSNIEGRLVCGLVFVSPKEGSKDAAEVRTQLRGGQSFEKKIAMASDKVGEAPENFVFLVDSGRSAGVLGQGANEFAQYVADVTDIQKLIEQTLEVQAKLEAGLSRAASAGGS